MPNETLGQALPARMAITLGIASGYAPHPDCGDVAEYCRHRFFVQNESKLAALETALGTSNRALRSDDNIIVNWAREAAKWDSKRQIV